MHRLLSALWMLTVLTGCSTTDGTGTSHQESMVIRAATYNIKHGRGMDGAIDLERTADVLRALNADIIALQEVDDRARRSGGVDQASWLAERLDMHSAYGSFMAFQGGRYGLAILSKAPILSHASWRLPDGNEPRVALAACIRTDQGEEITAVAVHFDWVENDTFRFEQARETIVRMESIETPWIAFGDFNDVPDSRTIQAFERVGDNACKPSGNAATFPSDRPEIEIDFIFSGPSGRWHPAIAEVIPETVGSDHRPVITELHLIGE